MARADASPGLVWVVQRGAVQSAIESVLVLALALGAAAVTSPRWAQAVVVAVGLIVAVYHFPPERVGVDAEGLVYVGHWRRRNYALSAVKRVYVMQTPRTAEALYVDVEGAPTVLGPIWLGRDVRPFLGRLAAELEHAGLGGAVDTSALPYMQDGNP